MNEIEKDATQTMLDAITEHIALLAAEYKTLAENYLKAVRSGDKEQLHRATVDMILHESKCFTLSERRDQLTKALSLQSDFLRMVAGNRNPSQG